MHRSESEETKCASSSGRLDLLSGGFSPPVQLKVFVKVSPERSSGPSCVLSEPLWCFLVLQRPRGRLWIISAVQLDESLLLHSNMQVSLVFSLEMWSRLN